MTFVYPPPVRPGDRVAVLSPSSGLAQILPLPFDLGLERLAEDFGLEPVEYPTTRRMNAGPADRAADVNAAFADESITAVIAGIGGDDQITVIPYLDTDVIRANPKRLFAYSDNTNLLNHLFQLGIVAFHGGMVMTEFGRPMSINPYTEPSLRAALFTPGPFELTEPDTYRDESRDWADPGTFRLEPHSEAAAPWVWLNTDRVVEGPTWGGCLEIVSWIAQADRIHLPGGFTGGILLIETSEEMPGDTEVFRILRNLGERGLLDRFDAVLAGRAKAWSFDNPQGIDARRAYQDAQREAIIRAVSAYRPGIPMVFGVDFGHTDPNYVIPYGGTVRVDGPARRITVTY